MTVYPIIPPDKFDIEAALEPVLGPRLDHLKAKLEKWCATASLAGLPEGSELTSEAVVAMVRTTAIETLDMAIRQMAGYPTDGVKAYPMLHAVGFAPPAVEDESTAMAAVAALMR